MKREELIKKSRLLGAFEEAIEIGLNYESTILMIFMYFRICNIYGPVINWNPGLRSFWLKIVTIHSDPERSEEKKKARIYTIIKNKWFGLQNLNFSKKA